MRAHSDKVGQAIRWIESDHNDHWETFLPFFMRGIRTTSRGLILTPNVVLGRFSNPHGFNFHTLFPALFLSVHHARTQKIPSRLEHDADIPLLPLSLLLSLLLSLILSLLLSLLVPILKTSLGTKHHAPSILQIEDQIKALPLQFASSMDAKFADLRTELAAVMTHHLKKAAAAGAVSAPGGGSGTATQASGGSPTAGG